MTDYPGLSDRARAIAYELVSWPSETGTAGEAAFAGRLTELLGGLPYFQAHPEDLVLVPSHGDPLASSVVAVVRGNGRRTLAMAGHFDTVATDNYLDLQHLACDPDALSSALIADLESRDLSPAETVALADLESGDFIPGRGMLDMKSGVAAGIAVLEHFSGIDDRPGNLVLFATPDEERNSQGMRSLRNALPALAERLGLDIVAGLNLDATSDLGDGAGGRAVYFGTIGKLLPFAMVLGQSSHAAYAFEGVSAHRIAAEIMLAIEANPDLCDRGGDALSPPPICLEARDFRAGYEVTTPDKVWLAFNWLFHSWTPAELFARFNGLIADSAARAMQAFADAGARYAALVDEPLNGAVRSAPVLTVEALRMRVEQAGADAVARLASFEASLKGNDNPLEVTRRLVEAMIVEARLIGPVIVTGFASLHYPHTRVDEQSTNGRMLVEAIKRAEQRVSREHATSLIHRPYFTGISDMSFFGAAVDPESGGVIAANTPASGFVDLPPADALSYPVVNIGPWGREFHQRLERLHAPYAFDVLPTLLAEIATELLGADQSEPG